MLTEKIFRVQKEPAIADRKEIIQILLTALSFCNFFAFFLGVSSTNFPELFVVSQKVLIQVFILKV